MESFTAFVAILPVTPREAVGPNPRTFPLVHKELFLEQSAAAEWCYFANADEPAPDAIRWMVQEVQVPALRRYAGDTPFMPDGAETHA